MIGRFLIESYSVCCCNWPERDNDLNMDLFYKFSLFLFCVFLMDYFSLPSLPRWMCGCTIFTGQTITQQDQRILFAGVRVTNENTLLFLISFSLCIITALFKSKVISGMIEKSAVRLKKKLNLFIYRSIKWPKQQEKLYLFVCLSVYFEIYFVNQLLFGIEGVFYKVRSYLNKETCRQIFFRYFYLRRTLEDST